MIMGNFLDEGVVRSNVMATSDRSPDHPSDVGMDHLTVVPANFDPDESDEDERISYREL